MMYKRILVAIDGSIFSEQVVQHAVSVAQLTQARLLLLHVSATEEADVCAYGETKSEETEDFGQHNFDQCNIDTLRSHRQTVLASGTTADLRLPSGAPAKQICQAAQEWGADLILMGHRSLANLDRLSTNSVSRYVLEHAPCSLLIVPDHVKLPAVQPMVQPAASTSANSLPVAH